MRSRWLILLLCLLLLVPSATAQVVTPSSNLPSGTTVVVAGSTATAKVCGTLTINTTSQATLTTSEEVLATYTVPANLLSANNIAVEFSAIVQTAATANSKTARARWGGLTGTIVHVVTSSTNNGALAVNGTITRTASNTQLVVPLAGAGAGFPPLVATLTDTAANDLVITGATATAIGDLIFKQLIVKCLVSP